MENFTDGLEIDNFLSLKKAMEDTQEESMSMPLSTKAEMIANYFVSDIAELKKLTKQLETICQQHQ